MQKVLQEAMTVTRTRRISSFGQGKYSECAAELTSAREGKSMRSGIVYADP
jgi:hypothetical protein